MTFDKKLALKLACEIAKRIVVNDISPLEGARKIWWEIWNEYGFPEELSSFVNDVTDYEESYVKDPKILENIKREAQRLLDQNH